VDEDKLARPTLKGNAKLRAIENRKSHQIALHRLQREKFELSRTVAKVINLEPRSYPT